MFDGKFRAPVDKAVKPLGDHLRRTRLTPDHLTVIGLVVAVGAAVALNRTAPPRPPGGERVLTTAESVLGYAMPPPLGAAEWFTAWRSEEHTSELQSH